MKDGLHRGPVFSMAKRLEGSKRFHGFFRFQTRHGNATGGFKPRRAEKPFEMRNRNETADMRNAQMVMA